MEPVEPRECLRARAIESASGIDIHLGLVTVAVTGRGRVLIFRLENTSFDRDNAVITDHCIVMWCVMTEQSSGGLCWLSCETYGSNVETGQL